MKTKISEEQARKMIDILLGYYFAKPSKEIENKMIKSLRDSGYIEQTAEEKFEEFARIYNDTLREDMDHLIKLAREAIREAKGEK